MNSQGRGDGSGKGGIIEVGERWLNKRAIADYFEVSIRWIEYRMEEGLPHAHIGGRAKFHVSEAEPWLEAHGHIERRGEAAA